MPTGSLASFGQSFGVADLGPRPEDQDAYAVRFQLVHEWRRFLFLDPQLPAVLLPDAWPGARAAAFFDRHAARLRPAADRYVDRCLHETVRRAPHRRG